MTESTNHSIFMNDTQGPEAQNPQDFVGGSKYDDPTNILDFNDNKGTSKKKDKSSKKKKTVASNE